MSCKSAYELNSNNAEILKWCAIITGTLAELRNLNDCERVIYVKEFKTYLDEALAGEPDSSVYHMNGRFCYRMATLTAEEKKSVMNAFHSLPTCTIDEALDNFYKAEVMNSGHIDNLMFLGKCYIAKGNASKAKKYLLPVVEITPTDEMDEALIAEVQELLDNIKEGNVQDENEENEDESEENEDESSDQTDFDELENSTDSTSNYSKEE
ncbi:unnamed protein product [Acanthocheilonema viteae]|uniref:Regulator of microtubule dynamics protein 1 n=1 Tax=Acanthocheilonema viteae TaxID=6277 RepID=A0A498SUY5_ACAVI|nr:unnamed protein product [Acanthocheilonema viteae]